MKRLVETAGTWRRTPRLASPPAGIRQRTVCGGGVPLDTAAVGRDVPFRLQPLVWCSRRWRHTRTSAAYEAFLAGSENRRQLTVVWILGRPYRCSGGGVAGSAAIYIWDDGAAGGCISVWRAVTSSSWSLVFIHFTHFNVRTCNVVSKHSADPLDLIKKFLLNVSAAKACTSLQVTGPVLGGTSCSF